MTTRPRVPLTLRGFIVIVYVGCGLALFGLFYRHVGVATAHKVATGDEARMLAVRMMVIEEIAAAIGMTMILGIPTIIAVWLWRRAWDRLEARQMQSRDDSSSGTS